MPLALFFLIELFLWLRWVLFAGFCATWRAVHYRGETIRKHEGLSRISQMTKILSISLGYCMPPAEIYAFGLYKSSSKRDVLSYIFTHELPAFHLWRNAKRAETLKASQVLQDKYETAKLLGTKGIPMSPLLAMVPRGAAFDAKVFLQDHPRIFLKPRHGSRSQDAFIIEIKNGQGRIAIYAVKNGCQAQPATQEQLCQAMQRDDFLVQPFLNNHDSFSALTPAMDVVTMRVITEYHPRSGISCYSATIEIPHDSDPVQYGHIILPIDLASGRPNPFPDVHLPVEVQARYGAIHQRMGGFIIPFWEDIYKSALHAHECFPDIYAIAWDYVATPKGPYLLEGNTGWGTRTPQMISGGLLLNINS